jgi:serine/threonine-protein kinase
LQLGRYQILKQLATGDFADVLLARATGLEGFARHVVIKCIRPELATEQRLVQSFIEEARIAASLHHQNIVQVHDIGEQDGAYFFAMEYVHGEDVRQLLANVIERREQVPLDHVVAIITATAAGLHHAHEQRNPAGVHLGLVHRDVCPANILLGYDGSVKLVDFGMAKAALRSTKTATGTLKGKASYMSPEQCVGKSVDRRTDTFALGIVLYELATARRLFKGTNEFLTMASIVEGSVPPPSTYRPGLPATFDAIALRALAREPELRYQSAEDLRAALEQFAVEQQLRTSNKALADYFLARFGHRLEPWHDDSQVRAVVADFDKLGGEGLVEAPTTDDDLLAKYAPRSTSPIMLAQSIATRLSGSEPSLGQEWNDDDDDEQLQTVARKPSADDLALLRPDAAEPPPKPDDDDFAQTVIGPPVFDDVESDVPGPTSNEMVTGGPSPTPVDMVPRVPTPIGLDMLGRVTTSSDSLGASVLTPSGLDDSVREHSTMTTVEDDTHVPTHVPRASTIAGVNPPHQSPRPGTARPGSPPALVGVGAPGGPKRVNEHVYVGAPAPAPGLEAFMRQYRRPIVIGAGAGLIVLVLVLVGVRWCGSDEKPRPAPAGSSSAR